MYISVYRPEFTLKIWNFRGLKSWWESGYTGSRLRRRFQPATARPQGRHVGGRLQSPRLRRQHTQARLNFCPTKDDILYRRFQYNSDHLQLVFMAVLWGHKQYGSLTIDIMTARHSGFAWAKLRIEYTGFDTSKSPTFLFPSCDIRWQISASVNYILLDGQVTSGDSRIPGWMSEYRGEYQLNGLFNW
jgi:hypothetical protein